MPRRGGLTTTRSGGAEGDAVVAVAQEGYVHGTRVLRAARVLVGRFDAGAGEA